MEPQNRDLLAAHLGVPILERNPETYRSAIPSGLDGKWVGGFMQPGFILNAATTMRATLSGSTGSAVDEYGPSTIKVKSCDGGRVELVKAYERQHYRYVGQLSSGTLCGYWHLVSRPDFCGLFWLARPERLTPETLQALESRVRSWSWRRGVLYSAVVATFFVGFVVRGAILAFLVTTMVVSRLRARRLKSEVVRWRSLLG